MTMWIELDPIHGFCLKVGGVALQEGVEMDCGIEEMASRSGPSVSSKCRPNRPATVSEAKWEHFINTNPTSWKVFEMGLWTPEREWPGPHLVISSLRGQPTSSLTISISMCLSCPVRAQVKSINLKGRFENILQFCNFPLFGSFAPI